MTTPNPNLSELRRLAEGATPGPWKVDYGYPRGLPGGISVAETHKPVTRFNAFARPATPEAMITAQFIAAANPATILALLDMVESAPTRVTET